MSVGVGSRSDGRGRVFLLIAAVLLGWIVPDGPVDRAALLGHALLRDPLFALWGATLLIGLWRSRRGARSLHRDTVDEPR